MQITRSVAWAAAIGSATLAHATAAIAQPRQGWTPTVEGLAVYQGSADLEDGGDFSASRAFLRAGGIYSYGDGSFVGLLASFGQFSYDFGLPGNQPWDDIRDIRQNVSLAVPVTLLPKLICCC